MQLILSALGQTLLCILLLAVSLLVTVVPDAREQHANFVGVLGIVTLLGVVTSVILIVAYTTDRERPIFKGSKVWVASLFPVVLLTSIVLFGVFG